MLKIIFRNLSRSELVLDVTREKLERVFFKFPDLQRSLVTVTLSMENSPIQAGPDLFKVNFRCMKGRYRGIMLKEGGNNLYIALAKLAEKLLERLGRFADKVRVRNMRRSRMSKVNYSRIHPKNFRSTRRNPQLF